MDVTAIHVDAPEADLVLSKPRRVDELPSYCLPDTDLEMGASLGNSSCWITTKGTGDIESVFSTYLGQKVLGALCVRYRIVASCCSLFKKTVCELQPTALLLRSG